MQDVERSGGEVGRQEFRIEQVIADASVEVLERAFIEGNEHELFDLKVQALAKVGYWIVDKSLTIDAANDPPVFGWILYREIANGEQQGFRPVPTPV